MHSALYLCTRFLTMKTSTLLQVLSIGMWLTACTAEVSDRSLRTNRWTELEKGSWEVAYAFLEEGDETPAFREVQLHFGEQGQVIGEINGRKVQGGWQWINRNEERWLRLRFVGAQRLEMLNKDWKVLAGNQEILFLSNQDKHATEQILKLQQS